MGGRDGQRPCCGGAAERWLCARGLLACLGLTLSAARRRRKRLSAKSAAYRTLSTTTARSVGFRRNLHHPTYPCDMPGATYTSPTPRRAAMERSRQRSSSCFLATVSRAPHAALRNERLRRAPVPWGWSPREDGTGEIYGVLLILPIESAKACRTLYALMHSATAHAVSAAEPAICDAGIDLQRLRSRQAVDQRLSFLFGKSSDTSWAPSGTCVVSARRPTAAEAAVAARKISWSWWQLVAALASLIVVSMKHTPLALGLVEHAQQRRRCSSSASSAAAGSSTFCSP